MVIDRQAAERRAGCTLEVDLEVLVHQCSWYSRFERVGSVVARSEQEGWFARWNLRLRRENCLS